MVPGGGREAPRDRRLDIRIIDGLEDEIVQTVSGLVQIRSVNPGYPGVEYDAELGGETEANNYLEL